MEYRKIVKAVFIKRLNRFVAKVSLDGEDILCHVKNTGRCKELLIPGATVFLEDSENESRKYRYSLVSVFKGDMLINMDSSAPNKAVKEFLEKGGLFSDITYIKPECTYGESRFDFYVEHADKKTFIEVKGVTLERDGEVLFPDAPTERGSKHIKHLCRCLEEGYEAYIIFVVQMKDVGYFTANSETDKAFADNLKTAKKRGVNVKAFDCFVTENSMVIADEVKVII